MKVQKESTSFTESSVGDTIDLITSIFHNVKKLGSFAKRTIVGIRQSFFGIIPLIRACLYMRYKKKADTILALEQQIVLDRKSVV